MNQVWVAGEVLIDLIQKVQSEHQLLAVDQPTQQKHFQNLELIHSLLMEFQLMNMVRRQRMNYLAQA